MYTFHKIINKLNSFFFFILSCGAVVRINSKQLKIQQLFPINYKLSSAQGFQKEQTKWF